MRRGKKLSIICLLMLMISVSFLLTSCGTATRPAYTTNDQTTNNNQTTHSHSYSGEWSYNDVYHWHAATCEHVNEIKDSEKHQFEDGVCAVCGYAQEAEKHTHKVMYVPAKPATCTDTGNIEHWYCTLCMGYFCDATCTVEVVSVELPSLGHDLKHHESLAPTCTEIGHNAYDTCSRCDYTTFEELKPLGHTPSNAVEENRVEPTCTVDGKCDLVVYCSTCGDKLSHQDKVIEALSHNLVHHEGLAPTCTEKGYEAYDTCSRCDYTTYQELAALGHTETSAVEENRVEATCTVDGSYDLVVYCSVCHIELARENKTIEALDHNLVHHDGLAPTCTEKGYEAYDTCSRCDYTTYQELTALGHSEASAVEENRVEATCTVAGSYDLVVYCSVCHKELSREHKTIEALGHDLKHHEGLAPTCTEKGYEAYDTCSRCDYTTYQELAALGHSGFSVVEENKVEATCTTTGSYDLVVYCSVCHEELLRENKTIEALGHNLVHHNKLDPTCTELGHNEYDTCSRCDYTTYQELAALGHTEATAVEENRVEATCTVGGSYDLVVYCSVCSDELSRENKIIEALGHNLVHHNKLDPTCTEKGHNAYDTCSRCDYTTYQELAALGHTEAAAVEENRVEATCTVAGSYDLVVYCSVCGEELSRENNTIEALGHDLVHHEGLDPTCTEKGHNEYDTCSRCDYTTYQELAALGHRGFNAVEENKVEATCTAAGGYDLVVYFSVCHKELSRENKILEALGHNLVHHDGLAPTCTEKGHTAYDTCSRCDYRTYQELAALGHSGFSVVEENRVEATCTVTGSYDLVVYCSVCHKELSRQNKILEALGHNLVHHDALAPTCTEKGYESYDTCTRCDYTTYKELLALGHTETTAVEENRVETTCTTDGSYDLVVYCSVCGEELTREHETITALGHDLVYHEGLAPTCTEKGYEVYNTCTRCDYTTYKELAALGHTEATEVEENSVEATCTVDGSYDLVVYCSVCGEELSRENKTIEALGHDLVHHEGLAPTCTEKGYEAYDICTRCDYTTYQELAAFGHTEAAAVEENRVEVTCITDGSYDLVVYCSVCGEELSRENKIISAIGHDLVHYEKLNPTCTEAGHNAYDACNKCDYTTYQKIEPIGFHSYEESWIVDMEPTENSVGERSKHCSVCDDRSEITEIPMLPYTDGLEYSLNSDEQSYSVIGIGLSTETEINITPIYMGLPVTIILDSAFENCSELTNIEIPTSVISIGLGAFSGCTNIESITLPFVGDGGYRYYLGCIFGATQWQYNGDFIPESLKNVKLLESCKTIGSYGFYKCSSLKNIQIPSSVTSIRDSAFEYCSGLTNIEIPTSVISIGLGAFGSCSSLVSIEIPTSVISIDIGAFSGCSSLVSIKIPSSVTSIENNLFFNCSSLSSISIPTSVESIGWGAFYKCSRLASIVIPTSVTSIGGAAFYNCSSLATISISYNVTSIGDEAFCGCSSLTNITIPASVTSIGRAAFSGCSSLSNITMYANVTNIGNSVFYNCSNLSSISIPTSVTSIESYAFYNCSSLTSVEIPSSVTSIGEHAFSGCSSLASVAIPSSVTSIGERAFNCCSSLTSVIIPNNVTSMGEYAFAGCSSLASLTFENSKLTSIEHAAFYNCSSLTSVVIPSSVTSIGVSAFGGCSSLVSVVIPTSVNSIESNSFGYYSNILIIYYKGTPEQWYSIANADLFDQTVYFYSDTTPTDTTYTYWYFDYDGNKKIWLN